MKTLQLGLFTTFCVLLIVSSVEAQTMLKVLHGFAPPVSQIDGVNPQAGLVLAGNTLYGTAFHGGGSGSGTIYKINTDGTGYLILHSFEGYDGNTPHAGLVIGGSTLYGVAGGGSFGGGTIFEINTDGTEFANLYNFSVTSGPDSTNLDGASPNGMILSGNTLYGTTINGGTSGVGVVYSINTDGTGFKNLHSFAASSGQPLTNSDGANVLAGLALSGQTLYGTARYGGNSGNGTLFAVKTDGSSFTNIHNFTGASDGANPYGAMVLVNNTLYGTTYAGGAPGNGTVFAINTDFSGFTNIYTFSPLGHDSTNLDGGRPPSTLASSGDTLYGTSIFGGPYNSGEVFSLQTNGAGFKVLYSFSFGPPPTSTNSDGYLPYSGVIASTNGILYGTTQYGNLAGFGGVYSLSASGGDFVDLHAFALAVTNSTFHPNVDGANPYSQLVLTNQILYGTTYGGGVYGFGSIFRLNTDGSEFTNLYNFTSLLTGLYETNDDGANPMSGLILGGSKLYGASFNGGGFNGGTVFSINSDGTGFTNLHAFNNANVNDGASPHGSLILENNVLYGTTIAGGAVSGGTVFAINADGTGFTILHSFDLANTNDGAIPYAGLNLSGNKLYGVAVSGGSSGYGVIFALDIDGENYTNLYSFSEPDPDTGTNDDGADPVASLTVDGNILYGTTAFGGTGGSGTLFSIRMDGTGFRILHVFNAYSPGGLNGDGAEPWGSLTLSGNTLFGTTERGGIGGSSEGTIFAIHTDGTGYTNLYNFTGANDGGSPYAGVILSSNTLFGTTETGGPTKTDGTVFALNFSSISAPSLAITSVHPKIVLAWPANGSIFSLQYTTNLASGVWQPVNSGMTVVGGNYVFTNTISAAALFFRLQQ